MYMDRAHRATVEVFTQNLRATIQAPSKLAFSANFLAEALKQAWEHDLTPAKIECAYRLLDPVMGLIQAGNGGNAFKLPHTGLTKQMREDGWDI